MRTIRPIPNRGPGDPLSGRQNSDQRQRRERRNDADDVRLLVTKQEQRAGAASAYDKTFSHQEKPYAHVREDTELIGDGHSQIRRL